MSSPSRRLVLSPLGRKAVHDAIMLQKKNNRDPARWSRIVDGLIASPWPGAIPLEQDDEAFLLNALQCMVAPPPSNDRHQLTVAHLSWGLKRFAAGVELDFQEGKLAIRRLRPHGLVEDDEFVHMVEALEGFTARFFPDFMFALRGVSLLRKEEELLLGFSASKTNLVQDLEYELYAIPYFPDFTIAS